MNDDNLYRQLFKLQDKHPYLQTLKDYYNELEIYKKINSIKQTQNVTEKNKPKTE